MARAWRTAANWLVSFAAEHWPELVFGAISLVTGYVASLGALLRPYGPIAWIGVALVTYLVLALGFWLSGLGYRSWVQTRLIGRAAETGPVNPLAGHFSKQRL